MAKYRCSVCDNIYDEEKEGVKWDELPDDWVCPVCESAKHYYAYIEAAVIQTDSFEIASAPSSSTIRTVDDTETHMADIHKIAETGESIIEPMRTKKTALSWDDILIKGAQLAKMPLNHEVPVNTRTIIGPGSKHPLVIESPIFVTHMSFGALSKEAKLALAKGSAAVKTATSSGEGGILPESLENSYKYIFEYVPNRYSVTEENLKKVDAIEIKIGQSAKPGMGGHLPGNKVTEEISTLRRFSKGIDIFSPAHFDDITNKDELKKAVKWLRETSNGRPVGIKFAAGNIESDMEIALYAEPDFITIDGRAGATAAAPKFVKSATSVPSIFALHRARKFLDHKKAENVSLIITGGLRVSSDFAKALAMGADAVAIGTSALIACGCQQYRMCNTGKCPMGITTQNPDLRSRLNIEKSASQLQNFLKVSTDELTSFARLTGNDDVHKLSTADLCTVNSEISNHTTILHA